MLTEDEKLEQHADVLHALRTLVGSSSPYIDQSLVESLLDGVMGGVFNGTPDEGNNDNRNQLPIGNIQD